MGQDSAEGSIDLREYITKVSGQLTERIEHQRKVMLQFAEARQQQGESIDYCPIIDCRRLGKYRVGIQEAVRVLEETRRSFRSRQLGQLRKQLESLLAEDEAAKA